MANSLKSPQDSFIKSQTTRVNVFSRVNELIYVIFPITSFYVDKTPAQKGEGTWLRKTKWKAKMQKRPS